MSIVMLKSQTAFAVVFRHLRLKRVGQPSGRKRVRDSLLILGTRGLVRVL